MGVSPLRVDPPRSKCSAKNKVLSYLTGGVPLIRGPMCNFFWGFVRSSSRITVSTSPAGQLFRFHKGRFCIISATIVVTRILQNHMTERTHVSRTSSLKVDPAKFKSKWWGKVVGFVQSDRGRSTCIRGSGKEVAVAHKPTPIPHTKVWLHWNKDKEIKWKGKILNDCLLSPNAFCL